ncbi:MAG: porin [Rhodobacteraceae bacterium]|nr:porin [Paracoccaceae bacterium]
MKKVLLATSILAASAGFAAAEVAVSGSARMGLFYDGNDTYFSSRVRIVFTASGETDGGLSFGASMRADQDGGNGNDDGDSDSNTNMKDATVYISGAFGKLTFGDVDSAAQALVGQVSAVGFTGLGSYNEVGYFGSDPKTAMLYEYSTGAVTFALGAGQLGSDAYSVAVKYSTDAFSVALGYEDEGFGFDDQTISLGGSATFGAATVKAVVLDSDHLADTDFALSVDYVAGAATITAFYHDAPEVFGLGATYDLGGGAAVKGGIVSDGDDSIADIGITMSF